MSLLKKFKKMILGESENTSKISVTEVSQNKSGETVAKKSFDKKQTPAKSSGKNDKKFDGKDKPSFQGAPKEKRKDYPSNEAFPKREERKVSSAKGETGADGTFYPENSKAVRVESPTYSDDRRPRFDDRSQKSGGRDGARGRGGRGRGGKRGSSQEDNIAGVNLDFSRPADMGTWTVDDFQIETAEGKSRFHDFGIPDKVMRAIQDLKYEYATPIQALILPESFKKTDVSGRAQTGTGKTAAFLVTIFKRFLEEPLEERVVGTPRALIMAPTRELVIQIEKDARALGKYCGFNIQSVFGGINYEKQKRQIENRHIDILVATPGRLLDYKEQNILHLDKVEILVIDEADRMLDMGFIPDMKEIINATPAKGQRQTMLFSATLTPEILRLASQWTKTPLSFEVKSKELTADAIEQRAYIVSNREKFAIMYNMIINEELSRVIVFGNRRDEVAKLADMFQLADISCGVLSGDISQAKRIRTLEDLRNGKIKVLCATDVAARGLHVSDVSHVFNYTLPDDPEDYVHRIGRTGRAGAKGISIIFATEEDAYHIPKIEKFTGHKLIYLHPKKELIELPEELVKILPAQRHFAARPRGVPKSSGNGGGNRGGNNRRSNGSSYSAGGRFRGGR